MGVIDYVDNFCTITTTFKRKRKPLQTVEIKVRMDCDGCERRVKNAVTHVKGVTSVSVNRKESRVHVTGYVDPNRVLKKVRSTGKKSAKFWPYIQFNLVTYPYAVGGYDRRAPSGYVRNVAAAFPVIDSAGNNSNLEDEDAITLFSDDNTNACSVM